MRCPGCGRDNPLDNCFCTFCGSSLMQEGTEEKGGWKGLPFYTRVTISGLLVFISVYTGLSFLFMVSGGVAGIGDAVQGIVFYALFMIPTLVIVVLAWRKSGISPLAGPIWAMVMLLIFAPSIPNALGAFNSFFDAGLLLPGFVSLLVAAAAGILGFLRRSRGAARDVSTTGERWVLRVITAIVVGLMAVSGTLHLNAIESVDPEERATSISVEVKNSAFKPARLTVPEGSPVKFVIKNRDLTVHTFTIEELGIGIKVLPGSEELIELPSPPAGTYIYLCTYGIGFSLPIHRAELESDPSVPSDRGTLVVSES